MARFKRNQVVAAIAETVGAKSSHASELESRLQRLLVTDRRLAWRKRADAKANARFAFYSQQAAGSGREVMFSEYEAFALLTGFLMLQHGIPQGTVVSILRELRSDLESAHGEFLRKDPRALFDRNAIQDMAKPGMIATDTTDPVFLVSVQLSGSTLERVHTATTVCRGHEALVTFLKKRSVPGLGATFFELVVLMHRLSINLAKTRPIKRGRSSI